MGSFEKLVERLFNEGEKVVIQRTITGYVVKGWNRAGQPFSMTASSPTEAASIQRKVEAGTL